MQVRLSLGRNHAKLANKGMWEANRAASQWDLQLRHPPAVRLPRAALARLIDPEAAGQSAFECIKQAFLLSGGKQLCATIVSDGFHYAVNVTGETQTTKAKKSTQTATAHRPKAVLRNSYLC